DYGRESDTNVASTLPSDCLSPATSPLSPCLMAPHPPETPKAVEALVLTSVPLMVSVSDGHVPPRASTVPITLALVDGGGGLVSTPLATTAPVSVLNPVTVT